MKRNRLILATIPLVVLGILALVKLFPRTVPLEECSPLYRQYAGHEDIEATFIKDYPVDDTTLVDVTLLRATTDSAWESLCIAFTPYEFTDSNKYINNLIHDTTSVTFRAVSKDDCRTKVNPSISEKHNSVFMAAKMRAICIFHINRKEQSDILIDIMLEHFLSSNTQSLLP